MRQIKVYVDLEPNESSVNNMEMDFLGQFPFGNGRCEVLFYVERTSGMS